MMMRKGFSVKPSCRSCRSIGAPRAPLLNPLFTGLEMNSMARHGSAQRAAGGTE